MRNKGEQPAFPTLTCDKASLSQGASYTNYEGITIRDYFAAAALTGILANARRESTWEAPEAVNLAYEMADAMILERQKEKK